MGVIRIINIWLTKVISIKKCKLCQLICPAYQAIISYVRGKHDEVELQRAIINIRCLLPFQNTKDLIALKCRMKINKLDFKTITAPS